ncbi:SLX4-like protein [Mya arenaria]|uniref:SLX4-like protein n=1 Tax=Mya arenaria TaxID=6604 RepID=A0ABY7DRR6_MYAAR|nr:SLX4-like protein [Mya arenaria]
MERKKKGEKPKLSLRKKNSDKLSTVATTKSTHVLNTLPKEEDLNESSEFAAQPKFAQMHSKPVEIINIEEETDTGEKISCQVCHKDLTCMNSQRRMQHVNKCIDRQEASEQAEKEGKQLLEQAQTAILDCPMCGRACKTQQSRKSHLKRCSVSLGVSTEQMLKLVRDQETERENLLAAGVMPANISQFEEDVQVAMAISTSLSDPQTVEAPRRAFPYGEPEHKVPKPFQSPPPKGWARRLPVGKGQYILSPPE